MSQIAVYLAEIDAKITSLEQFNTIVITTLCTFLFLKIWNEFI